MSEPQALTRDEISAKIALRAWQDDAFRARVLSDANGVFEEEFQEKLPSGMTLKVVEDDAQTVHFVIPAKPSQTEDLSEQELEAIAGGWCGTGPNGPKLPGKPFPLPSPRPGVRPW